jgi:hypothetical protein
LAVLGKRLYQKEIIEPVASISVLLIHTWVGQEQEAQIDTRNEDYRQ